MLFQALFLITTPFPKPWLSSPSVVGMGTGGCLDGGGWSTSILFRANVKQVCIVNTAGLISVKYTVMSTVCQHILIAQSSPVLRIYTLLDDRLTRRLITFSETVYLSINSF